MLKAPSRRPGPASQKPPTDTPGVTHRGQFNAPRHSASALKHRTKRELAPRATPVPPARWSRTVRAASGTRSDFVRSRLSVELGVTFPPWRGAPRCWEVTYPPRPHPTDEPGGRPPSPFCGRSRIVRVDAIGCPTARAEYSSGLGVRQGPSRSRRPHPPILRDGEGKLALGPVDIRLLQKRFDSFSVSIEGVATGSIFWGGAI